MHNPTAASSPGGYGDDSTDYGKDSSGYGTDSTGYGDDHSTGYGKDSSGYGTDSTGYGDDHSTGYGKGIEQPKCKRSQTKCCDTPSSVCSGRSELPAANE